MTGYGSVPPRPQPKKADMIIGTHDHQISLDLLTTIRNEGVRLSSLSLMYTDTIEHDPHVLRFVIEMMGADRVMLGSDMPFPSATTSR